MAETQIGTVGVAWSLVTGATGTGVGTFLPQSVNVSKTADRADIKGAAGSDKSVVFFNKKQTITLEVVPSGNTIALADAANIIPEPGAVVTVTDADDTDTVGSHTGKYFCVSATKSKTIDGAVRITMELEQNKDTDLAAAIAAA